MAKASKLWFVVNFHHDMRAITRRKFSTGRSLYKDSANRTVLYDFHKEHGGKMVDFAGWEMPVQYKTLGIKASHLHTREKCSLFDVSHMLQTKVYGKDKEAFIETMLVGDIKELKSNSGTLSTFTNDNGGILDDVIVNKTEGDFLYVVSNAGCSDKIKAHFKSCLDGFKSKGGDVNVEHIDNGLVALQGPLMNKVLQDGIKNNLAEISFMENFESTLFGIPKCRITRCGYTGEDGVEISVPASKTVELCEKLLSYNSVELAGLGARDSLRLEAGLCLYGNDIDETTSPVEAALTWCIGKRRRKEANFPGASVILNQIKAKPSRRRVGLTVTGAIARHGASVEDNKGSNVGEVTSGCPSPTLSNNIAMAYLPIQLAKAGTEVFINIRNRKANAIVTKMPFVPAKYYFKK
ncbi:aminomethyltransferase, mitochondrial-like [Clavelina lepadiformis]|uniref:Aminomethyltransferase n=1 Tax=Clavelina lepadiformis TaxID=159417 RepID=A0ABP0GEP9_CLALP